MSDINNVQLKERSAAVTKNMMSLSDVKRRLIAIEENMDQMSIAEFSTFETNNGDLTLYITDRLRRKCRKGKVWKSN